MPKEAIVDLERQPHFINYKMESWMAARTIDSFRRNLAEHRPPLSVHQFLKVVRAYAYAEDIPLYAEVFARTV